MSARVQYVLMTVQYILAGAVVLLALILFCLDVKAWHDQACQKQIHSEEPTR